MSCNTIARSAMLFACLLAFGLAGCQTTTVDDTQQKPARDTGSEFREATTRVEPPRGSSISSLKTIYFDFDRAEVRSDARRTLKSNASTIKDNRNWGTVTVEGHCDERGSEEYNLALGDRRASAVRRYLVDLGVQSSRLRTVSFGEDKPAVRGHNEAAWRYNRRSEFTSGS